MLRVRSSAAAAIAAVVVACALLATHADAQSVLTVPLQVASVQDPSCSKCVVADRFCRLFWLCA
jgi:hypothetical protein